MQQRSKRLARQLKKYLETEHLERDLELMQTWAASVGTKDTLPPKLLNLLYTQLGSFLDSVDQTYEQLDANLQQAQKSLSLSSLEVEERNKALRIEIRKMSNLLNNMRQAIFAIDGNFQIVSPVSRFADEVFHRPIAGLSVFDVLYQALDQHSEAYAAAKSAITTVMGEDELQWELMAPRLPKRMVFESGQVLKASYAPLWNEDQLLELLLFVVEDITEVEALEKKLGAEREQSLRQQQMIQDIIRVGRSKSAHHLALLTDDLRVVPMAGHAEVMRIFHRVKGNARVLGFQSLAAVAHSAESLLLQGEDQGEGESWEKARWAGLNAIKASLKAYSDAMELLYSGDAKPERAEGLVEVSVEKIKALQSLVQQLKAGALSKQTLEQLKDYSMALQRHSLLRALEPIAEKLRLKGADGLAVRVELPASDLELPQEAIDHLVTAIEQMLRNAVDHGIESPAERMNKGKKAHGTVKMSWQQTETGQILLRIEDDGRGLDPARIRAAALRKKLLSPAEASELTDEQALRLIWKSGVSTAEKVSESSGRGVGLDLVIDQLEKVGAKVLVQTQKGEWTRFEMEIPPAALARSR